MTQRYAGKRALFDDRKFNFGDVWILSDELITIPQADGTNTRKLHSERWVVITSNNVENYHPLCPIVTVSPLSHVVELAKEFDLELLPNTDNVKDKSLLQIKLMQPILKKDLATCKGPISEIKKVELQVLLEDFLGLAEADV
ncbi:hypothetical protein H9647_06880 [Paenibacillus sp. Sa2BVA9]|uniref:Type II toxin-antitoxin system PemK/MazF family toxin n=1 Tax=Paenibacillus gallinarum TaxID=2762232 RepID=A0ABR8SW91_9BACL|nr:hypothetical protein [Paenibacillus gallinarum]